MKNKMKVAKEDYGAVLALLFMLIFFGGTAIILLYRLI